MCICECCIKGVVQPRERLATPVPAWRPHTRRDWPPHHVHYQLPLAWLPLACLAWLMPRPADARAWVGGVSMHDGRGEGPCAQTRQPCAPHAATSATGAAAPHIPAHAVVTTRTPPPCARPAPACVFPSVGIRAQTAESGAARRPAGQATTERRAAPRATTAAAAAAATEAGLRARRAATGTARPVVAMTVTGAAAAATAAATTGTVTTGATSGRATTHHGAWLRQRACACRWHAACMPPASCSHAAHTPLARRSHAAHMPLTCRPHAAHMPGPSPRHTLRPCTLHRRDEAKRRAYDDDDRGRRRDRDY